MLFVSGSENFCVKFQLEQLPRIRWIATSLSHIAKANGKLSKVDRARFLEIARGSALECAACLDVLEIRKLVAPERIIPAKERLVQIVNMLMGMLKRFSARAEFLREDEGVYALEHGHE